MQAKRKLSDEILIERIKLVIKPNYNWVLFSNGTVVILDKARSEDNVEDQAIALMKQFGPVYAGTSAGDMTIKQFNKPYGWLVSGHGPGIFTYVHPSELQISNPEDILVGIHGRSKRDKDSKEMRIIHVSRKTD